MTLHKPLKIYGQNYLVDNNTINKIIKEFNIAKDEQVLEIGPGEGALTKRLVDLTNDLTVVEIDKRKIEFLKDNFPGVRIIQEDFLNINLQDIFGKESISVIGNIPYNITSPIIYKLTESKEHIRQALLMVQYEVAKKITADKESRDYGILNVITNSFFEVDYCFKISPNVFYPKPKVDSAIVKLKTKDAFPKDVNEEIFIQIVKSSFGNRRKNLKNSLSNSIFSNYDFSAVDHLLKLRAEQLGIEEFLTLTRIAQNQNV